MIKATTKSPINTNLYSLEGKKLKVEKLMPEIFGVTVSPLLISRALKVQQSQQRITLGHTKTRAERRGGGRKPWRQKGTGRARHGSTRSPIWRKGGITFGPRSEKNFALKINTKEKVLAIKGLLSQKASDQGGVIIIESLDLPEAKTKKVSALVKKLPAKRSHLFITDKKMEKFSLATRNMKNLKTIVVSNLNVLDLLQHEQLIFSQAGLDLLQKKFSKK